VRSNLRLPRAVVLADGSYLSVVYPCEKDRRHATNDVRVRVVEYRLEGVADAEPLYRLVTTILDEAQAPAADLAALYHERWEIEGALAELKTHLRGAQVVLRSKTPHLVRQEFWGLLLAHFAIKGDRARHIGRVSCTQIASIAAECSLKIVRAERQEQMARSVHRRGAPVAGTEDGVQAPALESDQGDDLLV